MLDKITDPRDVWANLLRDLHPEWTVSLSAGEYVRITHTACGFHAPCHDSLASYAMRSHKCGE